MIDGATDPCWVLESEMLPRWKSLIRSFNNAPSAPVEAKSSDEKSGAGAKSVVAIETKSSEAKSSVPPTPLVPGVLPPFAPLSAPVFKWGSKDGADFAKDVDRAYESIARWRKNVFKLPSGQSGKHFTQALARLLASVGERSPLERVALKAAALLAPLLLQKPAGKLTYRDNVNHLTRRLALWEDGNLKELLKEGSTIQSQLASSERAPDDSTIAKRFAAMVFNNNLKGAMSLVSEKGKGGILAIDANTKREMSLKHPKPEPMVPDALLKGEPPPGLHSVFFSELDGELVKKCTLRTKGGAGVSQQEDVLWHKMVTGYKDSSSSLCNAVAALARRLATEYVDPLALEALLANRGVAIDKCPGIRPVGVGEIVRRIIGKTIMSVSGEKVQEAVGALQLCGGQPAGVESAIHAMRGFLDADDSDGVLLIDADNAFNRVNRATVLWNVQFICPALKHALANFYRSPTRIFMKGDGFFELLSQEGTTQGCPLAMAMYALALVPLTKHLQPLCKQVWYADDATGCDKLERLRKWFDALLLHGPAYGYFPKPAKCILVTKSDQLARAKEIFKGSGVQVLTEGSKDTGIEINCEGTRHLGAAIGNADFRKCYLKRKIDNWISTVKKLAGVAVTQPHAAFAAFTHCLQGQWTFLCRTMPDGPELFKPLEECIRLDFIRALFKRDVNDLERNVLSLPARMGGMGIFNPVEQSCSSCANSMFISAPLVRLIQRQEFEFDPRELAAEMKGLRADVDRESEASCKAKCEAILAAAPDDLKKALTAASEKGASSWVTAAPSFDHGTVLHKRDFTDACYMRYGWALLGLPLSCACGSAFNVQHALDCKLGGFRILQHNEVRDTIAQVMREAGHAAVTIEPELQPLEGEVFDYKSANKENDARSDIKCCGFWSNLRQAYFDIKVVSPFARSNAHLSPAQLFKNAERVKIREYKERILNVEHADFNPLVFTTCGGMSPQSHIVIKRLAEKLSSKLNLSFSVVSGWLRCRLSFALLRTTLLCVRATRCKKMTYDNNVELAVSAARLND